MSDNNPSVGSLNRVIDQNKSIERSVDKVLTENSNLGKDDISHSILNDTDIDVDDNSTLLQTYQSDESIDKSIIEPTPWYKKLLQYKKLLFVAIILLVCLIFYLLYLFNIFNILNFLKITSSTKDEPKNEPEPEAKP